MPNKSQIYAVRGVGVKPFRDVESKIKVCTCLECLKGREKNFFDLLPDDVIRIILKYALGSIPFLKRSTFPLVEIERNLNTFVMKKYKKIQPPWFWDHIVSKKHKQILSSYERLRKIGNMVLTEICKEHTS